MSQSHEPGAIEKIYRERMAALSPKERVSRSMAMLRWTREMLARRVTREQGEMSPERLKWEVAKLLYASQPQALALIEKELADVSD